MYKKYKLTITEKGKKAKKSMELTELDLRQIASDLENDVPHCALAEDLYQYLVDLGAVEKKKYRVYFSLSAEVEAVSSDKAEEIIQERFPGVDIDNVDEL